MPQFDSNIHQPWILSFFLSFSIIIVNSESVLHSLSFRTKDHRLASSETPAVIMTLWLDSIIYQCIFVGSFPSDTLFVCNNGGCCLEIGTFECADYLNGQLLVENNGTDSIIIEEIILSTTDAAESIEYGISRWCVNTNTGTGWGRFYWRDRDDMRSDVEPDPCVNESPSDTNYDAICVDNNENCKPSRQLMYFNLNAENAHTVNVLLMNGTDTTAENVICDSSDSSDSEENGIAHSSSFESAFISDNKEMNGMDLDISDGKHSLTLDISDATLWNLWLMCIVFILVSAGQLFYCCVYMQKK